MMWPPGRFQMWRIIFILKSFLHPSKQYQLGNLTCLITSSTHNWCLSYNMKSSSCLHSTNNIFHTINIWDLISKFKSTQKYRLSNNQNYLIQNCNNHESSDGKVLLYDLVLDTSHTLESNYLLDQLQCSIKAAKFWCGDNDILNNFTLQVFLTITQMC